jgi:hypothetical protein
MTKMSYCLVIYFPGDEYDVGNVNFSTSLWSVCPLKRSVVPCMYHWTNAFFVILFPTDRPGQRRQLNISTKRDPRGIRHRMEPCVILCILTYISSAEGTANHLGPSAVGGVRVCVLMRPIPWIYGDRHRIMVYCVRRKQLSGFAGLSWKTSRARNSPTARHQWQRLYR